MKTQRSRMILLGAAIGVASTAIMPRQSNADTTLNTTQGAVELTDIGVIHRYVHQNVPAGTTVRVETVNLANSSATVSYLDTVLHVFDLDTRQPVASNDDCGSSAANFYSSCLTLPSASGVRSYMIYVHAYNGNTHGQAELRIAHDGTAMVDTEPFTFGGVRAFTGVTLPSDTLLFTRNAFNYPSPPIGTRLLALNYTTSVLALDDNEGGPGYSNIHIPAAMGSGGSFVIGAHTGLLFGSGLPDIADVALIWNGAMNYMWPLQKKVEDTAYEILRAAANAPDGRWFTAFAQAFGGRITEAQAISIKASVLEGQRYPVALEFVNPSVLAGTHGQALGAYAPNKIFLSNTLTEPYTAGNVFIEEIAHHFDHVYGGTGDAPGDEGHIFWSYIVGEIPTAAELAELKATSDAGTIVVGGQSISVEFLGLPKWLKKVFGTVWSGIKTTGGWVWSGATTVGGAMQSAASATWNGAQVLGGWIATGATVAAEKTVEHLKRTGYAGYNQFKVMVDSVHDQGLGIYDGAKIMAEGVADIGRGNFQDGVTALFVGLVKLHVDVPLSTFTGQVLGTLSTLQMQLWLEPIGRPYTPSERAEIDWVFWGNSTLWAWRVLIKEGFCGWLSANGRPTTLKSDIYMKNKRDTLTPGEFREVLVHESVHVWQWWNGGSSYILDSILYQGLQEFGGAHAYDWSPPVDSGTQWPGLTAEQQAEFVEDAFHSGCYVGGSGPTGLTSPCMIIFPPPCPDCPNISRNYETFFVGVDGHIQSGSGAP
jgi:hypothetical protein